jgi:hypothetical protein
MSIDRPTAIATIAVAAMLLGTGTAYATGGTFQLGTTAKSVSSATDSSRVSTAARRAPVKRIGTATSAGFLDDGGTPSDPTDDVIFAVATCPARSQATGGGARDFTDGVPFVSVPIGSRQWFVISTADPATNNPTDLRAYARCYNPRANVPNTSSRTTARNLPASVRQMARKAATR